jgi:hypothetical protein
MARLVASYERMQRSHSPACCQFSRLPIHMELLIQSCNLADICTVKHATAVPASVTSLAGTCCRHCQSHGVELIRCQQLISFQACKNASKNAAKVMAVWPQLRRAVVGWQLSLVPEASTSASRCWGKQQLCTAMSYYTVHLYSNSKRQYELDRQWEIG